MTKTGLLLVLIFLGFAWSASSATNTIPTIHSGSRQFILSGALNTNLLERISDIQAPGRQVRLDPATFSVVCERIKKALLHELQAEDSWRGRIFVQIRFMLTRNPVARIEPFQTGGWQYRIVLPDEIETNKITRVVVQALLLEMANRDSEQRLTEVPLWLAEGMTAHLKAVSGGDFNIQPHSRMVRQDFKGNPLESVRKAVLNRRMMSFQQLGQPTLADMEGGNWDSFQLHAHLLVAELLRLPGGRREMQDFLRLLPHYMNWQMAFLQAYQAHFQSFLDVEKWWTLQIVNASGLDQLYGWTLPRSMEALDVLLQTRALTRISPNELPVASTLPLQKMIRLWDFRIQHEVISQKVPQLKALRLNANHNLTALIDDYASLLEDYLKKREQAGRDSDQKSRHSPDPSWVMRETVRQLDLLDLKRKQAREWIQQAVLQ